jgi:hypothetical protein
MLLLLLQLLFRLSVGMNISRVYEQTGYQKDISDFITMTNSIKFKLPGLDVRDVQLTAILYNINTAAVPFAKLAGVFFGTLVEK